MPILRPFYAPYLQPQPAQLLQQMQLTPEQKANGYNNYFQPQAPQDPNAPQQAEFEQTPYDTAASLQNQAAVVKQTRQNQFQYQPVLNDPIASTQSNPVANFIQTSAARPDFSQFYNQLNTISGTGDDATAAAQQQAAARQASILNQFSSTAGDVGGTGGNFGDRVNVAKSLIGVPYVWGHQDKNGTDCSGLVYQVLNATGTKVPRVTAAEYGRMGQAVSLASAMPGDVVYFDEPGATDHVGIYIGNGQMIDAPYTGANVRVDRVGNFTSIRRIGGTGQTGISAGADTLVPKQFHSVQQLGQQLLSQKGWAGQWNSFNNLVSHESGWNPTAQNPSSTAFGLGQFLNSTWAPYGAKTSDPRLQLSYMLDYIKSRYGDPNRAWAFWQQHRWY